MNPERGKIYIELLRSLTAFILGTGAGNYGLVTSEATEDHLFFLYFVSVLCFVCLGTFVAVVVYIDRRF